MDCPTQTGASCPFGSRWDGRACVYREVIQKLVCPAGTRREGQLCVIRDVSRLPAEPPVAEGEAEGAPGRRGSPPARGAQRGVVSFNSIPSSQVYLDGHWLGQTPIMRWSLDAGRHTVLFVHPERGRKVRSFELSPRQHKTIAVRLDDPAGP